MGIDFDMVAININILLYRIIIILVAYLYDFC